jgi:predicted small integral membrane protein
MDFEWMRWTPVTTQLFVGLMAMLTGLTVWELRSPSIRRKGFLPLGFTRGERFFLSILILVGTTILWMAFLPDMNWFYALPVAGLLIVIVVIWG